MSPATCPGCNRVIGEGHSPVCPEVVTDITGATHRRFKMPESVRAEVASKLLLQPPGSDAYRIEKETIENIPLDVLFVLDSLRMLADQDNPIAKALYERERARWGIDRPLYSFPT